MGAFEVLVLIVAAIVAAGALCWLAVSVAVGRVRRQRALRNGRVRSGGV